MARRDYFDDPEAPRPDSLVVAVTAIVRDSRGRILMIRREDNGLYSVPGGAQDLGETIGRAVVREVREETGIEVEPTGIVGVYSDPRHVIAYTDGEVRQEFSICFHARPTGGAPRTSRESTEVLWVCPESLPALNIHPSIRLRIEHGLHRSAPYFSL
ncbi:MAG TPA: NUDIX domain-containing protein [Actinopolymorphaceae bacterium]